jgi:ABC-type Na+ transport system ATPase subunit NatA
MRVTARDFSFNTAGGRCETCQGTGVITIDMQFLADVVVTCDRCDGRRFSSKVLGIRYRGKNIDDVLRMTVAEAMTFFADLPKITKRLAPLAEVGLGYLPLGQPTSTLSGGEAQRLKLASFLDDRVSPRGTLFLFDEPTTGLHSGDVDVLLGSFRKLIARGHSVVAIEHHLDFIAASDWVVDLGPGGGDRGGEVVAEGSPAEIAAAPRSETGRYLAAHATGETRRPSRTATSCSGEATAPAFASTRRPSPGPTLFCRSAKDAPWCATSGRPTGSSSTAARSPGRRPWPTETRSAWARPWWSCRSFPLRTPTFGRR